MKYNIVTWNMQGSGENLSEQLNYIFTNLFDDELKNIICLQEFGSFVALEQYSGIDYSKDSCTNRTVYIYDVNIDERGRIATAIIHYVDAGQLKYECGLYVAWDDTAKNLRCGTGMLYDLSLPKPERLNESIGRRPAILMRTDRIDIYSFHAIAYDGDSIGQVRTFCKDIFHAYYLTSKYIVIAGDFNQTPLDASAIANLPDAMRIFGYPLTYGTEFDGKAYVVRSGVPTQGPKKNRERIKELDFFIINYNLFNYIIHNDFEIECCKFDADGDGNFYSDHDPVMFSF